jgi:putative Mg2+ transporter-C (MgtC) family protein
MQQETLIIVARILGALIIGSLIGLERSFHGRPAGFRTHALVSIASTLLMLVTVYQGEWMTAVTPETIRTDPTRMAQGIMMGIGFLGAGVIFKEGLTVRGLTTAASIWVTAANRHFGWRRLLSSGNSRCHHHARRIGRFPYR